MMARAAMAACDPAPAHCALVTRPQEESETLAAALGRRGIAALIAPMLEIAFRPAMRLDLAGVQAVLCTSANGVRALAQASGERGVPLFAVGEASAAAARRAGFTAVANAAGDAGDLARLAVARLDPQAGRLVHVTGSAVAGDLAGALSGHGFTVARAVLYEARPAAGLGAEAQQALSRGLVDLALFFSPRSATIFVALTVAAGLAQACAGVTAVSISAATDRALAALGWRARHVAGRPSQRALLAALDRVCARPGSPAGAA